MRRMSREAGQAGVWAEISAKSARLDAASPTDAVEAVFFKHSSSLDEYLAALPRQEGQCGAIVAVGGRVVCLDYVSRSEVYAGLYAKLLRGYALDAVEQPGDAPVPEDYARLLVRRIARAKRGLGTQQGLGVDRDVAGRGVAGSELVLGDEVVALSVFPTGRA